MTLYSDSLIIYGIFLVILLIINILYFFQIFRYRLPGDASLTIVIGYIALVIITLIIGGLFMGAA